MSADNTARIAILLDGSQAKTEAKATSVELNGIGAAGKAAGVSSAASFNQVDAAVKLNRAGLVELQNLYRLTVEAQGEASAGAQTLAAELRIQGVAVGGAATAEVELAIATTEQAQAANLATRANVELDNQLRRHIATLAAQAAGMRGNGILLSQTAVLMGATSVAGFGLVVVLGLVVVKLIEMIGAKEKEIKITEAEIKQNEQLAAAYAVVSRASIDYGTHLQGVADAYKSLVKEGDAIALVTLFGAAVDTAAKKTLDAQVKTDAWKVAIQNATVEQAAARRTIDGVTESYLGYEDILARTESVQINATEAQQVSVEATAKASKATDDLVKSLADLIQRGVNTEQELRAIGTAANWSAESFQVFETAVTRAGSAQEQFNAAVRAFKVSPVSASNTEAAQGKIEQELNNRIEGQNAANMNKLEMARLNSAALKELVTVTKELIETQARGAGIRLTDEQTHQRLVSAIGKESEGIRQEIAVLGLLEEKQRKTKDVGPQLEMEIAKARARLDKDNFQARLVDIGFEYDLRLQRLRESGQATSQNIQREGLLRSLAIETATREEQKAIDARLKHEIEGRQKTDNDLERMRINGLESETAREVANLALKLKERIQEIHKEVTGEIEAQQLIDAARRESANILHRWLDDKEKARRAEWAHAESQLWQTVAQERLAIDKKTIDAGLKLLKDQNKAMLELNRQFGANRLDLGGFGGQFEQARLISLSTRMKALGVDVKGVNQIFGTTTRTVEQLEARLQKMEEVGIDGLDHLQQQIQFTQQVFQAFGSAVSAGFEALVSGSQSFGDAMLSSFLRAIAQMAAAYGAFYISVGVAELFTPGMHHAGVVHIAQGIALEALAGVLGGAASLLGGGSKSAAASAGTSTASTTADAPRPGVPPRVISFPTSGTAGRPLVIQLDRNLSNDLINGKKVVVMDDFNGGGKNTTAIRKRISKWKSSPYAS